MSFFKLWCVTPQFFLFLIKIVKKISILCHRSISFFLFKKGIVSVRSFFLSEVRFFRWIKKAGNMNRTGRTGQTIFAPQRGPFSRQNKALALVKRKKRTCVSPLTLLTHSRSLFLTHRVSGKWRLAKKWGKLTSEISPISWIKMYVLLFSTHFISLLSPILFCRCSVSATINWLVDFPLNWIRWERAYTWTRSKPSSTTSAAASSSTSPISTTSATWVTGNPPPPFSFIYFLCYCRIR